MTSPGSSSPDAPTPPSAANFVRDLVRADNEQGTFGGRVQTRFPPEPNGYLHIGHAKAIHVDFGIAEEFGGVCNLRFDDTNPDTEDTEYVDAIVDDLAWIGYTVPDGRCTPATTSSRSTTWAELLITKGLAYVDDQDSETISAQRGGYGKPGVESPFRDRSVEENLDLFRRMRAGEFDDGARVLRAKVDMQHENMQLRDPVMYRIRRGHHHRTARRLGASTPPTTGRTGRATRSRASRTRCARSSSTATGRSTTGTSSHLPLPFDQPRQIEFARLELTHTVTSKRRLAKLVADGVVDGWDDPRLPTIRALRRRGYPSAAIKDFCTFIGVGKTNSRHQIELLESFVRNELNRTALRRMAVLRPLKLVITNWPAGQVEHVHDPATTRRTPTTAPARSP